MSPTRFILIVLFGVLGLSTNCQTWQQMIKDPNANFYDIQKSFNAEWEGKEYKKGYGWKQYKRWEHFWQNRVNADGSFPTGNQLKTAYSQHQKATSKNQGNSRFDSPWQPKGPFDLEYGLGRINVVQVDPSDPDVIYIGASSGGLWKTEDSGQSWIALTDFLPTVSVSGIAINPNNPSNIYISTGDFDHWAAYGTGVWKSEDGGITWEPTGLQFNASNDYFRGGKIAFSPSNTNVLFCASTDGLYRTSDAGDNWTKVLFVETEDFEFNPADPNIMYAVNDFSFYRSTDMGESFLNGSNAVTDIASASRLKLGVTSINPNVVYILGGGDDTKVWKSGDSGLSFEAKHDEFTGNPVSGQYWYDMAFDVSPTNEDELIIGGVRIFKSFNSGKNFTQIGSSVHADIHWLEYFDGVVYCGSDGGIDRSYDQGDSWEYLSKGLQITQYYDFSNSPLDINLISAGAQDNGTHILKNGEWRRYSGGDGLQTEIDHSNPDVIYHSYQRGNILKTVDAGNSHFQIFTDAEMTELWETPFKVDPNNSDIVYVGYAELWKSEDGGISSTKITSFDRGLLTVIQIAESDSDIMAVAVGDVLFLTTDGGDNWSRISDSFPLYHNFSSVLFHPTDPTKMWVTFSRYSNEPKLYYSDDQGNSWTNFSQGLPDFPVHKVIYQNGHEDNCLYAATEIGVYYRDDSLAQWTPYMQDLPNTYVSDIEIVPGTNIVRACSYGRGIWENTTIKETIYPPTSKYIANDNEICPEATITFTNNSYNYSDIVEWYFEGGTPETATDENPEVLYSEEGIFDVRLIVSNGVENDTLLTQDYIHVSLPKQATFDYYEGFEESIIPDGWKIENLDASETWNLAPNVGGYGNSEVSVYVNNYAYNANGKKDAIITTSIDLSTADNPTLQFDYAYTYYETQDMLYTDSLQVYYSGDCGIIRQLIWEKGGEDLATADPAGGAFFPLAEEWHTETIDLNPLKSEGQVQFYFVNVGGYGNNLYLDNINLLANQILVDNDNDGFTNDVDCDDENPNINPDAQEIAYNGIDDDCDETTLDDDLDMDGFVLADDCDDENDQINPDVEETVYNGIDDDCDESTLDDDLDMDGFVLADDCDDENDQINPNAEEIPNNGIDEDCDGLDAISSVNNIGSFKAFAMPNPFTNKIAIRSDQNINVDFVIINTLGEKLYHIENKMVNSSIDLSNLSSGFYLLEIRDLQSKHRVVLKIIKE